MTVRTFYYKGNNFYNTAPKGVKSKDEEIVRREVVERGRSVSKDENSRLPRRLQLELAGRILDVYTK